MSYQRYPARVLQRSIIAGCLIALHLPVHGASRTECMSTQDDFANSTQCLALTVAMETSANTRQQAQSEWTLPDEIMWRLLEEPFKSDDARFIEYLQDNNLLHKQDRDGDTVLSIAALNGQVAVIDYLAAKGIDINSTNRRGNTVFDHAIKLSDPVKAALLRHGADINHSLADGRTPLINAVLSDAGATVSFLISHGADISRSDYLRADALFYAAAMGNLDIVQLLVESPDPPSTDALSRALQTARNNRHAQVGTYLISKGAIE